MCLMRARIKSFASGSGTSFTDDDLKSRLFFATSLEVEKETGTDSTEEHGIDIRKSDVVRLGNLTY